MTYSVAMQDINLKATQAFEAIARLGTITRAAKELRVTPSAVSQQLQLLEAQLGVKLFRREKRRLILTLDGDRFFQTTTQAFAAIRNARASIGVQQDFRSLSLRVSPSFGVRWLAPKLGQFTRAHQEWSVSIDATADFTSFETEAIDADLRYGYGDWAGLAVEHFLNSLVLPVCSPAYLEKMRAVSSNPVDQLSAARLIDSVKTLCRWDTWLATNNVDLPRVNHPLKFDRTTMSIEMAKQGEGIALDNLLLSFDELERGDLVLFSTDFPVLDFPALWFVCPPRHFNRRIVRLFFEWLQEISREHDEKLRDFLVRQGCHFQTLDSPGVLIG